MNTISIILWIFFFCCYVVSLFLWQKTDCSTRQSARRSTAVVIVLVTLGALIGFISMNRIDKLIDWIILVPVIPLLVTMLAGGKWFVYKFFGGFDGKKKGGVPPMHLWEFAIIMFLFSASLFAFLGALYSINGHADHAIKDVGDKLKILAVLLFIFGVVVVNLLKKKPQNRWSGTGLAVASIFAALLGYNIFRLDIGLIPVFFLVVFLFCFLMVVQLIWHKWRASKSSASDGTTNKGYGFAKAFAVTMIIMFVMGSFSLIWLSAHLSEDDYNRKYNQKYNYEYDYGSSSSSSDDDDSQSNSSGSTKSSNSSTSTSTSTSSSSQSQSSNSNYSSDDDDDSYDQPATPSVNFSSCSLNPNKYLGNGKYAISVSFTLDVDYLKGHYLTVYMMPYHSNPENYDGSTGIALKALTHRGKRGVMVYDTKSLKPTYDGSIWRNLEMYINHDDFRFDRGTRDYFVRLELFDNTDNRWIGHSKVMSFSMTYNPPFDPDLNFENSFIIDPSTGNTVPFDASDVSSEMSSSSSRNSSSKRSKSTSTRRECPTCHGSKKIISPKSLATYGHGKKDRWCEICQDWVFPDHYHVPCTTCNGKGYLN